MASTVDARVGALASDVLGVRQRQETMHTDMATLRDMTQGISIELQNTNNKLGEAIMTQNEHLKYFESEVTMSSFSKTRYRIIMVQRIVVFAILFGYLCYR